MAQFLSLLGSTSKSFLERPRENFKAGGRTEYVPPLPGFGPVDSHFLHPEFKDWTASGVTSSLWEHGISVLIGDNMLWRKKARGGNASVSSLEFFLPGSGGTHL